MDSIDNFRRHEGGVMKELHLLDANERRLFFQAAADESKIPFEIIEKDFWVVWVLERLFSLKSLNEHLTAAIRLLAAGGRGQVSAMARRWGQIP